jgi:hypothetical protein
MKKIFKVVLVLSGGGLIILGIIKLFELIKNKKG